MGKSKIRFLPLVAACLGLFSSCAHSPTKIPVLSEMEGKKVALIEIDGEPTSRSIVEVALINQLVKRGTFEMIAKEDVEKARRAPSIDPRDWLAIARRAGADYALKAKVLQFDADTRKGYSSEQVEDSQMEEELGPEGAKTERIYKAASLTGHVRIELSFMRLEQPPKDDDMREAVAEAQEVVNADAKSEAIHLPPKLRFLEKLSNQAFEKFFQQYQ